MSADNWAICPRCFAEAARQMAERANRVETGYGVLSLEEFDALRAEVAAGVDEEALRTFREDYEQGTYSMPPDGRYYVEYKGGCTTCGLSFAYKHEERFFDPASVHESSEVTPRSEGTP